MIPQSDHPDTNFVGLIIGPRGETLKRIEKETGCKIVIRGEGSTKGGRGNIRPQQGDGEPLHVRLEADSQFSLSAAATRIEQLLVPIPDDENEHKKNQLRKLAQYNGTLREDEQQECLHCGQFDHKPWQCPNRRKTVAPWERDFKENEERVRESERQRESSVLLGSEYDSFMKELGSLKSFVPGISIPWME
ncbi:hypothetical protein RCL1_000087 [Eukaryota sp. TZLM3-RCL]